MTNGHPTRRRLVAILSGAAIAAGLAAATVAPASSAAAACSTKLVVAGDFNGSQGAITATANLAAAQGASAALLLGDIVYTEGDPALYGPRMTGSGWMSAAPTILPVPGNHDYNWVNTDGSQTAAGYYAFFGRPKWYAQDIACGYRVYALNSEETSTFPAQVAFVQSDLAANPGKKPLVMWHKPRWSSGEHGDNTNVQPLIDAFSGKAKAFFWGHDHDFERGVTNKIKWFVVGTGGTAGNGIVTPTTGSLAFKSNPGVLRVDLTDTSFKASFVAVP